MTMQIGALLLAALLSFGIGWKVSDWKNDAEDKVQLVQDVQAQNEQISDMRKQLRETIKAATDGVASITEEAMQTAVVLDKRNDGLEQIDKKTREISNAIAKLKPNCVLAPEYGRMYETINNEANSGRDTLYAPKSN